MVPFRGRARRYRQDVEVATLAAALLGAVSTAILGLVAFRLSHHAQRYTVQRAIGDLQSSMARFRADFPEIMHFGSRWSTHESAVLYGRAESADAGTIVRYYSYVDIGLEFCNTTLSAHTGGLLSAEVFDRHYRPLVRLFLAENYPFVATSLAGPYLSSYIRDELDAATRDGWNLALRHQQLGDGDPSSPSSVATE